jgi:hypothetical protein
MVPSGENFKACNLAGTQLYQGLEAREKLFLLKSPVNISLREKHCDTLRQKDTKGYE